jgi:hypothetical protein
MTRLPFELKEIENIENWTPNIKKEYLVQYKWDNNKSFFIIGKFSSVWFGFTFNWLWSHSSLQFSTGKFSQDRESFERIWEFIRLEDECISCIDESLLSDKDIQI